MKVSFTQKEFDELRKFQTAFNKKFGETAYVGTDSACVLLEYSTELKAMLRPFPPANHYDFEVRCLMCEDCKKNQPFICAKEENTFVCNDCKGKRSRKGNQNGK